MMNGQKNSFVKARISDTLIEMLQTESLDRITVTGLTRKAGVGRVSFYRNYSSMEDVLRQKSDGLLQQWGDLFESGPDSSPDNVFLTLFNFYREHRIFYMTLYKAGLSNIIMDTIIATARISPGMPNPEAYLKAFWAYGIFGWVNEWISRGMPETGDEMHAMFQVMK